MAANVSQSYLSYEYDNTYHFSLGKKPIHTDYSALSEEFESSHKAYKVSEYF